jgi:hypothetical protein
MMMVVQSVASVHDLVFVNGPDIEETKEEKRTTEEMRKTEEMRREERRGEEKRSEEKNKV